MVELDAGRLMPELVLRRGVFEELVLPLQMGIAADTLLAANAIRVLSIKNLLRFIKTIDSDRTPSNDPTCNNTRHTFQRTRRRAQPSDLRCDEQNGFIQDAAALGHLRVRQVQLSALPCRECCHGGRHLAALNMRCAVAKATCGLPLHIPTFISSPA